MAETAATINPLPPRPCRARNPISAGIEGASAHANEPAANTRTETTNITRRPQRSPRLPCKGVATATTSKYAAVTPATASGCPNDGPSDGSAATTTLVSSDAINMPSSSAANAMFGRCLECVF